MISGDIDVTWASGEFSRLIMPFLYAAFGRWHSEWHEEKHASTWSALYDAFRDIAYGCFRRADMRPSRELVSPRAFHYVTINTRDICFMSPPSLLLSSHQDDAEY